MSCAFCNNHDGPCPNCDSAGGSDGSGKVDPTVGLTLQPTYAGARCIAITRKGTRCLKRWGSAYPVIWGWDPVKGTGVGGPNIVLCRQHSIVEERARRAGTRIHVTGGWFGAYNEYKYGNAVWAGQTGWEPAPAWWAVRHNLKFGVFTERDNEVVA